MSIFSNRFSDAKQEAGAYTRALGDERASGTPG